MAYILFRFVSVLPWIFWCQHHPSPNFLYRLNVVDPALLCFKTLIWFQVLFFCKLNVLIFRGYWSYVCKELSMCKWLPLKTSEMQISNICNKPQTNIMFIFIRVHDIPLSFTIECKLWNQKCFLVWCNFLNIQALICLKAKV